MVPSEEFFLGGAELEVGLGDSGYDGGASFVENTTISLVGVSDR
jgi:hypothetical protein